MIRNFSSTEMSLRPSLFPYVSLGLALFILLFLFRNVFQLIAAHSFLKLLFLAVPLLLLLLLWSGTSYSISNGFATAHNLFTSHSVSLHSIRAIHFSNGRISKLFHLTSLHFLDARGQTVLIWDFVHAKGEVMRALKLLNILLGSRWTQR